MSIDVASLFQQAVQAEKAGNVQEALSLYQKVLEHDPAHADAQHMVGTIYLADQQLEQALPALQRAAQLAPNNSNVFLNLATACRLSNKLQEAVRCYEKAIQIDSNCSPAYEGIGTILAQTGKLEQSIQFLVKAVSLDAQNYGAGLTLSKVYVELGQHGAAVPLLEQMQAMYPEDSLPVFLMAKSLSALQKQDQAIQLFRTLLGNEKYANDAASALSVVYFESGQAELAIKQIEQLPEGYQQRADLLAVKAQAYNQLADKNSAIDCYLRSIETDPFYIKSWYLLASLDPAVIDDDGLELLERLANQAKGKDKAVAWFALARLYESRKRYEDEFKALQVANQCQVPFAPHSKAGLSASDNVIRQSFNSQTVATLSEQGNQEARPIFIYGLPRSGTTLTEQLLASHSQVGGAGEAVAFYQGMDAQAGTSSKLEDFVSRVNDIDIAALADFYLNGIRERGITESRFTDKAIRNFQVLGLHVAAFPNASLVRVYRHPMDVCFGAWKMLFNQGRQNFSYDLASCAHMYVEFNKMMDYWENELPNPVFHLSYEDLVSNQEEKTRELLEFCDLPWEEACLSFHENKRKVQTASINQVRKGLYTSALGRWKRYGDLLDPLRLELEQLGVEIPE